MYDLLLLIMIQEGNCLDILGTMRKNSFQLIMTSPPYANKRGAPKSSDYVEWFEPIATQLYRVLKEDGSMIINIKEGAHNGERDTYVLELILALKKQGWFWIEEYIWHKKNCFPGKWPNRFRDAWERCLHFSKSKKFQMYQNEVMVPMSKNSKKRIQNLSHNDSKRRNNATKSGMSYKLINWVGRESVYPTNVLRLATETSNKHHPAAYPIGLPNWFIRLFTKQKDKVLDPFLGSGTTAVAAYSLNRQFVGIEIDPQIKKLAESNLIILEKKHNRY